MSRDPKKSKFNFEELKAAATSQDIDTRVETFRDYFERFEEFPSYLFDNEHGIDARLAETIERLQKSLSTSEKMHAGIALLLERLAESK